MPPAGWTYVKWYPCYSAAGYDGARGFRECGPLSVQLLTLLRTALAVARAHLSELD